MDRHPSPLAIGGTFVEARYMVMRRLMGVSHLALLALGTCTAAGCGMTVYRSPEAQREIEFPNELGFQGLAFFEGKLYATADQGILEFDQCQFTGLCRWQKSPYKVIGSQGPWLDRTDGP